MIAAEAIVDSLPDPVLVLRPDGGIVDANRAARRMFGAALGAGSLAGLIRSPEGEFHTYLRRCSGSASPMIGSVVIEAEGGRLKFRTYGSRLPGEGAACVALRCLRLREDEFSILARQVRELNEELRERMRIQTELEQALGRNQNLLRELHHRVRNNIQIFLGLFSAAERETQSPGIRAFIATMKRRLLAVGTVQQLLHRSEAIGSIDAGEMVGALCDSFRRSAGSSCEFVVEADAGTLPEEVLLPLALILSELVTNAITHASVDGRVRVEVQLRRSGDHFTLIVKDDGPGFARQQTDRRSSGLGIVEGLCRQLNGVFEVETSGGAQCIVRFEI